MFLKSALLTAVVLLGYTKFFAQSGFPYQKEWKIIDSLINKKRLPKSALQHVNKIIAAAKNDKEKGQWAKSIIYKFRLEEINEHNVSAKVAEVESDNSTDPPDIAAFLKSVEAEELNQYLQENRYQLQNRTTIAGDTSTDIATWTISRITEKIRFLYLSSIENQELLKYISADIFDLALIKGNSRDLRPTLYDLLAWRALDYFQSDFSDRAAVSQDNFMENAALFSEAPFFMHYDFAGNDSLSNILAAIKIYQQLLKFHSKNLRSDALIDVDIKRIQFVYQYATMPEKDSLYMNALARITRQFSTLSVADEAWYLQANWWASRAKLYDALGDSSHRYDYIQEISLCEKAIIHPDSSEGKSNCEQLLKDIRGQSLQLKVEKVNIPNEPFRMLVSYKNVQHLYGRIIRIDQAMRNLFEQNENDSKFWSKLTHSTVEKTFQQSLPETKDYQQHNVEIKIDPLGIGQYVLLVSSDADFSDRAIMQVTPFFCSFIAFAANGNDYFVLDRDSGHPLPAVKVKSFYQQYHGGKSSYVPVGNYQTDLHGYFHLIPQRENSIQKLKFYYGSDYLSTDSYAQYNRPESDYEPGRDMKFTDNIFTDRSIYRPGQTVFFKNLVVALDSKTNKFTPAAQHQSKVFLIDANDDKIDSLLLKSNDFGSANGSFHLPSNSLNGQFIILDEETNDEQIISVEEYKRPSFYVKYDSLKGSYRVGDTIQLTGSALAYAENAFDDAKLSYRVYRESRFPYLWMYRFNPSNSETMIAHAESLTCVNGKFYIHFIAQPDKSLKKEISPVYSYRVESTITDASGESRSAFTHVDVSYRSFEIVSSLPQEPKLPSDSLAFIPVTTKNTSGDFVKEKLTIKIYPLEGPNRLIRERYWEQPDQFVMSYKEYVGYFPNDEYKNEGDVKFWTTLSPIFEKMDSTNENGLFAIDEKARRAFLPGWYLFEFKAVDVDGEKIIDRRYVEITENGGRAKNMGYNLILNEELTAQPGDRINIHTGSDAKNLFVVRVKQMIDEKAAKYSFYNLNDQTISSVIGIEETDRGGFALNEMFIKNNRRYSSKHDIRVPWTNKQLDISYQTWKDKTLPGSKEQWKIKINGFKKDKVFAEVLSAMYDASLDQFKKHSWIVPDLYPNYESESNWDGNGNFNSCTFQKRYFPEPFIRQYEKIYDRIIFSNSIAPERYLKRSYELDDVVVVAMGAQRNMLAGVQVSAAQERDYDKKSSRPGEIAKFTPPKIMKDEDVMVDLPGYDDDSKIQIRRNLNETAFFQPDLKTDAQGNVEISFTMPDALTQWKWMVLANTKDLSFGYAEKQIVTQKELMVQPNMPRFFREGDTMLLPVKIANLSSQNMTGTVQLEWMDADNNQNEDSAMNNAHANQPFVANVSQTTVVFFPVIVPAHFTHSLLYRVTAKTNLAGTEHSDGEENIIPVLSNRMLVTESLPLNMSGKDEKHFTFEKLVKSKESESLQNYSLTVEYTTNPAWYAVQSLPYLIEFPYECAEQTFNRFYANALASHIVNVSPALQAVFEKWKNADTAALLSNLQKNEEVKSVLIRETPWVLDAQSETQQKKNIALLFDMIRMKASLKSALDKLQIMQSDGGGFPWFKGGRDDRYMTQYIVAGIGHLEKLNAIPEELKSTLDKVAQTAITYLDNELKSDYDRRDKSTKKYFADPIQIQYLYMRSFFPDLPVTAAISNAYNFYKTLVSGQWMNQSVYMQGMIALFLNRAGGQKTAKEILSSLKENATESEELGMCWKSASAGYYWQEAPVETQSLLIETFTELHAEQAIIDKMKYWLLQQKRTTHWPTTKATADACYALLLNGSDWISNQQNVTIQLGNYKLKGTDEKSEAGTGYFKKRISGDSVKPEMGNIEVSTTANQPPSWGAVYWQYFENLDKITSANTQISISKNLFIEKNSDNGAVLEAVSSVNILKPGDKLTMRIIIKTDRDLEYVHLKDMRAACLEPVNVLSGYRWQDGLGYYETTQEASTSFFFDRLPQGTHVFEYPVYVTTVGNYSNGISTLECMYAPEFAAHSEGVRVQVQSK